MRENTTTNTLQKKDAGSERGPASGSYRESKYQNNKNKIRKYTSKQSAGSKRGSTSGYYREIKYKYNKTKHTNTLQGKM